MYQQNYATETISQFVADHARAHAPRGGYRIDQTWRGGARPQASVPLSRAEYLKMSDLAKAAAVGTDTKDLQILNEQNPSVRANIFQFRKELANGVASKECVAY